jgi:hypothetical protein
LRRREVIEEEGTILEMYNCYSLSYAMKYGASLNTRRNSNEEKIAKEN